VRFWHAQFCNNWREESIAKQMELKGRHFWILSEPRGSGWKATVVEVKRGGEQESVGLEPTAETRGAADDAAERKLRRMLQATKVSDTCLTGV
jgi:hypothetical protein